MILIKQLILAFICGCIVGIDREKHSKGLGIRTSILLITCSVILIYVNSFVSYTHDNARLMASLIQGIGFLGCGIIWRDKRNIHGITTSVLLIVLLGIGFLIGYNKYIEAFAISIWCFLILKLKGIEQKVVNYDLRKMSSTTK